MISYRQATSADQPAIVAFIRAADIFPLGLKWPNFILALDDATGQLVGTGQIKKHGDGSHELASIATAPAYQRQGIAHRLIEQLLARHPGVLYLTCLGHMESLYQQFGFRSVAPDEMTPYFRRLMRLAKTAQFLSRDSRQVLVMRRAADAAAPAPPRSIPPAPSQ
jgi:N-acetylglutamate synthase-like GNAT family acetyltransferase